MPEQICVPAHPAAGDADAEPRVRIELRRRGGEPVAIAFSSVAALVEQLGRAQPWMVMDTARLRRHLAAVGVREILLDPDLTGSPGRWERADLARLAGGQADG